MDMKMFGKRISYLVMAVMVIAGAFGIVKPASASGNCVADTSARLDATTYGTGATSVDMTITKASSGQCTWTAYMQYGSETGNWWTVNATTKSGWVTPTSPSYRSWSLSTLRGYGYDMRLKIEYGDGSYEYIYFYVVQ
jgi:hypothetical protein